MAKRVSPIEAAAALGQWERAMRATILATLRKGLYRVRAEASKAVRASGLGNRLWGRDDRPEGIRKSSLAKMFKVEKIKTDGSRYLSGIEVKGIPALMETGGRTAEHIIRPYAAKAAVSAARKESRRTHRSRKDRLTAEELDRIGHATGARLRFQLGGRWVSPSKVNHPGSAIAKTAGVAATVDRNREQIGQDLQAAGDALVKRMLG